MLGQLSLLALVTLWLTGCGGASTDEQSTDCPIPNHVGCAQQRGVYEITYDERAGGTCGSKPSLTSQAPSVRTTTFNAPCSGSVTWSSDFCTANFEVACPEEETGPGFTNRQKSETSYTNDGTSGTGVYELSIFDADGKLFCESTYDKHSVNISCDRQAP